MGINLIDKIVPKNDAFMGMVEADQVIGNVLGGGYLVSSCISANSIYEVNLHVSNSPTNNYYLQYTDANDLTWAEVVGGSDVAWSGASEFYAVSSNYVGHSGNTSIHYTLESILDDFFPSSTGKALSGATFPLISWYIASSSKLSESGSKYTDTYVWYNTSSNQFSNWLSSGEKLSRWYSESSSKLSLFTLESILDDFYPSTAGKALSGATLPLITWYTVSSSKLSESGSKYTDNYLWYNTSSNLYSNWLASGEKLSRWYSESSAKLSDISGSLSSRINLKQNSLDGSEYYPSGLGKGVSGQLQSHTTDTTIHFTVDNINIDELANTSIDSVSGNSIVWNGSEWIDKNVSAESGPVSWGTISIDGDKDFNTYDLNNVGSINIGTADTYGTYGLQVYGSTYLSGQITFIGQISGVTSPEWPSSAVNKAYVDAQGGGISYKGWVQVNSSEVIAHGCGVKPSWVNVCPSGTNPFMYSITVDETNITVYHTSPDPETFSWGASI
jgi:hypothetical protein